MIGQIISHYKILEKLGGGGMGVVYKAQDLALERQVALKFLPPDLTRDPDTKERFIKEAKAASSLDHPNICTIHEFGETPDGQLFMAMACYDGGTLKQRIERGPLKIEEAVDTALQIAEGLSRAHEAGIVHRDIKPANIMMTARGEVKIVDFGLAKLGGQTRLTKTGSTVGTFAYMSPEQVQGGNIDERTDIWSLGVVLFEMLTGRLPFRGDHEAAVLYEILNIDPEGVSAGRPEAGSGLDTIVLECLAKDAGERYQSIRELAKDLRRFKRESSKRKTEKPANIPGESPSPLREAQAGIRPRKIRSLPVTLIVIALVSLGIGLGYFGASLFQKVSQPSFQRLTFRRGIVCNARFAPDGKTIIYSAKWGEKGLEIFSVRLESPESRPLELANTDILSVSSKGEMAVLVDRRPFNILLERGTLARMPILGGTPREVLQDVQEADWSPDGNSLAAVHYVTGSCRLEYPIGKVLYETEGYISCPRISPTGHMIAFEEHQIRNDDRGWITVVDDSGNKRTLSDEFTAMYGLAWSPDGGEIWFSAQRSGESAALYGITTAGRQRLVLGVPGGLSFHDVSKDGRALLSRRDEYSEIFGLPPGASRELNLSWLDATTVKNISSDGKTFCFLHWGEGSGPNYTVYLGKTDGSLPVRLGEGNGVAISPDGKWVVTVYMTPPRIGLLPTGAGEPVYLRNSGIEFFEPLGAMLPDGKRILFAGREKGHRPRMFVQDIDSATHYPVTPEGVISDALSPDGKQLLVGSGGKFLLYPLAGGEPRTVIDRDSVGQYAGWSSDGRSVYLRQRGDYGVKLYRFELASGRKELLKELPPYDLTGAFASPLRVASNGQSYVYQIARIITELFLVEGLK